MIPSLALFLLVAAWPPVQGAVDVQVRNPNLGDPGCVLFQDGAVRCWPSSLFVEPWLAENWPRPQLGARTELAGVREFGGRDCALLRNGQVRCLGEGTFRDMGIAGAVQVVSGGEQGCARLKDGGVSCWGRNTNCVLGPRPDVSGCLSGGRLPPARVQGLPPLKWIATACGLTEEGALLCWGPHPFAPMAGRGAPFLERVPGVPPLARIWMGGEVVIGVTPGGHLEAWKSPTYGEGARPISIPGADKLGAPVVEATVSDGFAVLVLADGSAWVWGHQPGARRVIPALPPTWADPIRRVTGLDDAVRVSAASEHVCLVARTGRVRCFGSNAHGELGGGTIGADPVTVPTEVVDIAVEALPAPESKLCIATPEARLACLRLGPQCMLREPPPPVRCAGGARKPDQLFVPPRPPQPLGSCLCSCSQKFLDLARDQRNQESVCAMIPSAPGKAPTPVPAR
jgi:hypothetical protein